MCRCGAISRGGGAAGVVVVVGDIWWCFIRTGD